MANYDNLLKAVNCHIRCVRYDIVLESNAGGRLDASSRHLRRCSDADTVTMSLSQELTAVSDASSGHLRRCSDADTVKMSLAVKKMRLYYPGQL
eukprot:scaffold10713_cov108-Skeletonema_marinoi.AAC.1